MPTSPHALRVHRTSDAAASGGDLGWEEVPTPTLGAEEVLVRIEAAVIDADDLALVAGRIDAALPRTTGRGGAGVVVAVGEHAVDWAPGDPVAVDGAVTCGRCRYCTIGRDNLCVARQRLGRDRDGTHAQLVVTDARRLVPAPGGLDAAQVAAAARTVAVSYNALKRAGVGEDVTVAVHGLGGRGLHALLLAHLAGAQVVAVDADPSRRELAREWGAEVVVDGADPDVGARIREVTEGGADCSLELTAGPGQLETALAAVRPGGRVAVTDVGGRDLPSDALARLAGDELDLVGVGDPTLQDVGELLDLLADGRLDLSRSVERHVSGTQLPEVCSELTVRGGDPPTVVVTPD